MARPERVELPTFWFVARRSIQLSYGRADTKSLSHPAKTRRMRQNGQRDARRAGGLLRESAKLYDIPSLAALKRIARRFGTI
jgi:hypothetical protein